MNKFLDSEYLHNGTNEIYKEMWKKPHVSFDKHFIKPVGGLWTIPYKDYDLNDWMSFLKYNDSDFYDISIGKDNIIVKLKDTTKLLVIEDKNDFKNLKDSGLTKRIDFDYETYNVFRKIIINEILDYNKLLPFYDAIYINPNSDDSLSNFSVYTMLILNPDIIDYYTPIEIDYYNEKVISIGEKKMIKDLCDEYKKLNEEVKKSFLKKIDDYQKDDINTLFEIKKELQNIYSKLNFNIYNINKLALLKIMILNIMSDYTENKRLIKNKFTRN